MAAPAEEEKHREEPCYCWLFWRFNAPRTKTAKMVNRAPTVLTQTAVVHDVQSTPTIPPPKPIAFLDRECDDNQSAALNQMCLLIRARGLIRRKLRKKKKKKKKSCDADWATCLETSETSSVRKVPSREDGEHAVAFLAMYPFLTSGAPVVGSQRHSTPQRSKWRACSSTPKVTRALGWTSTDNGAQHISARQHNNYPAKIAIRSLRGEFNLSEKHERETHKVS
ncbi:hypothetical protein FOXYSP1_15949 [Fusarium oxysporum f. sp. phaseoli]